MLITMLKSKIHRATVTGADLNYEGSIAIDKKLCDFARLLEFERVDIYNCNNGQRFSTYVIYGRSGAICLNGAAARLVHPGDSIIIASYCLVSLQEAKAIRPTVVFVNLENEISKTGTSNPEVLR